MRPAGWLAALLLCAACAAPQVESGGTNAPAPADLPPEGYGTLRQEQFSLELRQGTVQLRVTPLEEQVIRLAAPDTYRRLSALAAQQRAALQDRALAASGGGTVLFLISFFSREEGAVFQPSDVLIDSGGRSFRPAQVEGLTPGWGDQRLGAQQPQSAIYAFPAGIDLEQPLLLRYGSLTNDQWREIVPVLREERSRAQARAAARPD